MQFIPKFNNVKIKKRGIIGEIIDYTPLYRLLSLDIFKFEIENRYDPKIINIYSHEILTFIANNNFDFIKIKGYVYYNNQLLNAEIGLSKEDVDSSDVNDILLEALNSIMDSIKYKIYLNHHIKKEFDMIFDAIHTNIQSGKFYVANMLKDQIDHLSHNMVNEIERIFNECTRY